MKSIFKQAFYLLGTALLLTSCSSDSNEQKDTPKQKTEEVKEVEIEIVEEEVIDDPLLNKGIGPIESIELGEINDEMAIGGQALFKEKCSACHKVDKRYIGPAMEGVTERRSPEWIMNMILNPEVMVKEDPIAKDLLGEYLSPMANQSLTEEEARAILEYFRTL